MNFASDDMAHTVLGDRIGLIVLGTASLNRRPNEAELHLARTFSGQIERPDTPHGEYQARQRMGCLFEGGTLNGVPLVYAFTSLKPASEGGRIDYDALDSCLVRITERYPKTRRILLPWPWPEGAFSNQDLVQVLIDRRLGDREPILAPYRYKPVRRTKRRQLGHDLFDRRPLG